MDTAATAPAPRGEATGLAAMMVATALWGGTFVVLRDSLPELPPARLVAARFACATLVFAIVLLVRFAVARPRAGAVRDALIGGAVGAAFHGGSHLFQAIGLTETSAGTSAFLTCAGTLFAAVFAWPLLGLRPPPTLALGLALALAGSALLGVRGDLRLGRGEAWTLAGALVYALQIVALARWARRADPFVLAGVLAAGSALIALPFAGDLVGSLARLPAPAWARLGYLVLAGSVVAPVLQVIAQRTLPPGRIGLLFALEPVWALVFALTIGGERFVLRWWLGATLTLLAVLIVEARASRRAATPRPATA